MIGFFDYYPFSYTTFKPSLLSCAVGLSLGGCWTELVRSVLAYRILESCRLLTAPKSFQAPVL